IRNVKLKKHKRKIEILYSSIRMRERIRDMNKKWMIVIISLIFIVALIGVGGKMFIDKRAEQKEAEKIEAERMSVEALKNTFKNIQEVKFKHTTYEEMAGVYFMTIKMINKNNQQVEFSYSYSNGDEKITSFDVVDKNVQSKGKTRDKVKVTFSNENEKEK